MNRPVLSWVIALTTLMVAALSNGAALADRRVALVVGNSHYNNPGLALTNPTNDADDVSEALRSLGFEVIHKNDTNKRELDLAMAQFARAATDADAALFFYAGHALQYQGQNYLMPTDAELEDEVSLRYQMMMLDDVRAALDRASGIKIMILDACRNSPIVDRLRRKIAGASRSVEQTRGLARIDKTQGMVVAYATAADDVAADGSGRNSPYTAALLKRLKEPGLEIEIMFRRIAADVNAQTNGRQRPETYVSLLNEYYLNQTDRLMWEQVKDSADPDVIRGFIERFPSSRKSLDARMRLDTLDRIAREAVRARADDEARAKAATAERERTEREAARRRKEEEERAKVAAAAEQQRLERDAVQRRQAEEQTKAAAAERARVERETAQRQQEEQRVKAAAAERERTEREAAERRQAEEQQKRTQVALLERERLDREAAKRIAEQEELARQKAESARRGLERESGLVVVPAAPQGPMTLPQAVPQVVPMAPATTVPATTTSPTTAPQAARPTQQPAIPQAEACEQDSAQLARLRASQSYPEVVRFEQVLTCERLRPQVLRLRESLAPVEAAQPQLAGQQQPPVAAAPSEQTIGRPTSHPTPGPGRQSLEHQAVREDPSPAAAAPAASRAQGCKSDEERLVKLRASPDRDEVMRFERELTCKRLRAQVMRLRESLGGDPPPSDRSVTVYGVGRQATVTTLEAAPPPALATRVPDCKGDEEKLIALRASLIRDDIIRFEKELTCEKLRLQVLRLKESVGDN